MKDTKTARAQYEKWRNKSREGTTLLALMFAMARGKCPICDVDMILTYNNDLKHRYNNHATLDHTDELNMTKVHDKWNLKIMCFKCNGAKSNGK